MEKTPRREMIGLEGKVLRDTLRRLHRRNAVENIRKLIMKTHPADLAYVFRSLSFVEQKDIFEILAQTDKVADFFSELDEQIMLDLVEGLTPQFMANVVTEMAYDDAADLLEALPMDVAMEIRTHMEVKDRYEVEELLKYDPDTAGGIMSPDFMYLDEDLTVEDAIAKVQKRSEEKEMVFYLYITHGEGQLAGVLSLRELLLHPMHRKLKNIMNTNVITVATDTPQDEVAHIVSQYNMLAVPVVDAAFNMVGIVTVDDVIDVLREEANEDFMQMAGAGRDQEILLKPLYKKILIRAPWLLASWLGGIGSMYIINSFQDALSKVLALASFIPIITGMGGNIATQSSTIIVRGLATGRVNLQQVFQVVVKETCVGVALGTFFGLLLGTIAFFSYADPVHLGFVVGFSVFVVMTMAATVGTLVPLLLKRLNIDAAVATGPFITTSVDVLGVGLFFFVAKTMLNL
ncbi:magnesium transporter [Desulfogranum japonicum]|uniref:magnesium transporter n=1 Tax=Desulfogranum japonicum TaxID=231447 RepID=UPI00048EA030|nr:magnesium transporter [Desulfogranum japonicum]